MDNVTENLCRLSGGRSKAERDCEVAGGVRLKTQLGFELLGFLGWKEREQQGRWGTQGSWQLGFDLKPHDVDNVTYDVSADVSMTGWGRVSDELLNILLSYRHWANGGIFTVEGQANFYPP